MPCAPGSQACTSDIVVMMDGDGSTEGEEIVRFVSALVAGADYAKGSRFANSGGSDDITPGRRLGNRVLSGHGEPGLRHPVHRPLLRLQRVLVKASARSRP